MDEEYSLKKLNVLIEKFNLISSSSNITDF